MGIRGVRCCSKGRPDRTGRLDRRNIVLTGSLEACLAVVALAASKAEQGLSELYSVEEVPKHSKAARQFDGPQCAAIT